MRAFSSRSHLRLLQPEHRGPVARCDLPYTMDPKEITHMHKHGRWFASLAMSGALLAVLPAVPVAADDRTCRGEIGGRTVDNVKVPAGATCTLRGTNVEGNIIVKGNATLIAIGVRVDGNVQAENSRKVVVKESSRVGGDVQVFDSGFARVYDSRIGGNIQVEDNDRDNAIRRNVVGGDVQAFQNTGGVAISRNRIDGNLQCKENRPRPTGANNVVDGNKEDQCRGM